MSKEEAVPGRQPGVGLGPLAVAAGLVAGTLLAWEVALTRVLAIRQWSHCAYLIISVALLGFGASGTALALLSSPSTKLGAVSVSNRWGERERRRLLRLAALLFAPSLPASHWLAGRLPFELNQLLMKPVGSVWELPFLPFRSGSLLLLELVLALPFFLGACALALSLLEAGDDVAPVYGANLLGSGIGAGAVVGLLYLARPGWLAALLTPAPLVAAGILTGRASRRWQGAWVLSFLATLWAGWCSLRPVQPSEYKPLATALLLPATKVVAERWSPLSLLTLVSGPTIRLAPGLSLAYSTSHLGELPRQLALYFDGDSPSAVIDLQPTAPLPAPEPAAPTPPQGLAYLDYLPPNLVYHLLQRPSVLVLGMGGASDVVAALGFGARSVTAVELDPLVVRLVGQECPTFTRGLLHHPDVRPVVAEARGFLETTGDTYDLIQVPPLSSFSSSAAGMFAPSASYLFTIEGLGRAIDHLSPTGVLSLTDWVRYPERDVVRLLATVIASAEVRGLEPAARVAVFRGYSTVTILFSRSPWTTEQLATLRRICTERGYDLCYCPGVRPEEVNRFFPVLGELVYYQAALHLFFGDREDFYRFHLFRVRPATDDQPYFFSTFRWRTLPWLIHTLGTQWLGFVDRGYLFLVLTLVQTTLLAAALIAGPLFLLGRVRRTTGKLRTGLYFFLLGLGYMCLEIAAIQRFLLLLPSPVHSLAVVLSTFLVGSGVGSLLLRRSAADLGRAIRGATLGIALLALLHATLLPGLLPALLGRPFALRLTVTVLSLLPLALLMGIPFPAGFALVRRRSEALTSWAWGVNGCASVLGASLATLLAIEAGLAAVTLTAAGVYLGALLLAPLRECGT
jgi:hypothetical protein